MRSMCRGIRKAMNTALQHRKEKQRIFFALFQVLHFFSLHKTSDISWLHLHKLLCLKNAAWQLLASTTAFRHMSKPTPDRLLKA